MSSELTVRRFKGRIEDAGTTPCVYLQILSKDPAIALSGDMRTSNARMRIGHSGLGFAKSDPMRQTRRSIPLYKPTKRVEVLIIEGEALADRSYREKLKAGLARAITRESIAFHLFIPMIGFAHSRAGVYFKDHPAVGKLVALMMKDFQWVVEFENWRRRASRTDGANAPTQEGLSVSA